jgi:hypothetical protein
MMAPAARTAKSVFIFSFSVTGSSGFATLFSVDLSPKTGSDLEMSARIIQVRPSRNPRWQKQGGYEVFETEGVSPVYCGEHARESALSYARQRAGYGRAEIQVLDDPWDLVEMIGNEDARPLV